MSTRSVTCFRYGDGSYRAFYRHCDGYPTGLGLELAVALREGERELDDIKRRCGLEGWGSRTLSDPADAFKHQGDLEYIYAVELGSHPALSIYRTSNPYLDVDFVFSIWSCYVEYFPEDLEQALSQAEKTSGVALGAMAGYHKALTGGEDAENERIRKGIRLAEIQGAEQNATGHTERLRGPQAPRGQGGDDRERAERNYQYATCVDGNRR